MITKMYTRSVPLSVEVGQQAHATLTKMLERQNAILRNNYNQGKYSPHMVDIVTPSILSINPSLFGELDIEIGYPITIRFLDLKKTLAGIGRFKSGGKTTSLRKKRYYTPIYNKLVFGHLYGRGYSLSNIINIALKQEYQNYFQNLKNITESAPI